MKDIIRSQVAASIAVKQAILADEALMARIADIAALMVDAYKAGHKTLWAGNGGSAADAQHMAGELVNKFTFDRPGLPALSLSTDTSIITAIAVRGMCSSAFPRRAVPGIWWRRLRLAGRRESFPSPSSGLRPVRWTITIMCCTCRPWRRRAFRSARLSSAISCAILWNRTYLGNNHFVL